VCLGVPGRLIAIGEDGVSATVDIGGAAGAVSLALLVDERPAVGDWLAVHMGFALATLSETEARDALDALVLIGPGDDVIDEAALFAEWGMADRPGAA
jgi:hydrogenase expression/formation protein HypC